MKTTSCSSRSRLTTLSHCKRSGAGNFRVSRSPASAVLLRHPSSSHSPLLPWLRSLPIAWPKRLRSRASGRESLAPDDVVALVGDLGAGKTHFVKGLLEGLESADEVTSPTFTLLHEYRRRPAARVSFRFLPTHTRSRKSTRSVSTITWTKAALRWSSGRIVFPQAFPERTRWLRIDAPSAVDTHHYRGENMKVLALELSSPVGSVAFCDDGRERLFRRLSLLTGRTPGCSTKISKGLIRSVRNTRGHRGRARARFVCRGADCDRHCGWLEGRLRARACSVCLRSARSIRRNMCRWATRAGIPSSSPMSFAAVVWKDRRSRRRRRFRAKLSRWRHLPIIATQPLPQFEDVTIAHPSALAPGGTRDPGRIG